MFFCNWKVLRRSEWRNLNQWKAKLRIVWKKNRLDFLDLRKILFVGHLKENSTENNILEYRSAEKFNF